MTEQEATREYCGWLGDIEARIAAARTGQVALSDEQVKALAGRWRRERLREEEQKGEPRETLEAVLEALPQPCETVHGLIANAVEKLLQSEGLNADDASRKQLAAEVLHLHNALCGLVLRRSNGDYSADAIEPRIPEWKPPETATIGGKWTVMIVTRLSAGPMRFSELKRDIGDISQKMLTSTLRELEQDGFIRRVVTPVIPPRVDYELTELGRALLVPLDALGAWAVRNQHRVEEARTRFKFKVGS